MFATASSCRYLDEYMMGDTFLNQLLINREVDMVIVNSLACDGHGIVAVNYI